ncbi:MAG: hypothetical protein HY820_34810 [Acidobacteria bacterium]|nr:hypothetical protein [Acidobacteriota bacterium]
MKALLLLAALSLKAQPLWDPAQPVRSGMRGSGVTVFSGMKIEPFTAEILGVLENAGPKQSIILARLSGGPLAQTGVLQGMSGSPVYIDGKLIGAVGLAFNLAKEPIAGIRPIHEMIDSTRPSNQRARLHLPCLLSNSGCPETALLPQSKAADFPFGEHRLSEIATPVSFSGFPASAIERFAPQLRSLGLEPRQGLTGGSGSRLPIGNPAQLKPGAMISVQLVSGDMSIGADGTVTHIDGRNLYAFGHRFVSLGDVDLPFASSEVITLLPNLGTSFKISSAREWLGTINHDSSTAVRGQLGTKARMTPTTIQVRGGGKTSRYQIEIVRDPAMTPFLLQMTTFAAIEATERVVGAVSFQVRQRIDFENAEPMESFNIFSGEFSSAMQAAQNGAIPLAYALQQGFPELAVKNITLDIDATPARNQVQVEDVIPEHRTVRPGETVRLRVLFAGEGKRFTRTAEYRVPVGATPGLLQLTVADGPTANLLELRNVVLTTPRGAAQVARLLNQLRTNTSAFLRIWRAETAYISQGEDLPRPPPSAANLLSRSQGASAIGLNYTSKIAEVEIPIKTTMVTGSKTIAVEVKE